MRQYGGQVRIVGGCLRGRRLPVLTQQGLRPTPARVRETLFNWLMWSVQGARCLDLFAGTGALGFEAYSRGAAQVVLVDSLAPVIAQLQLNKQRFQADKVSVLQADATRALPMLQQSFDIVFLDPPFGQQLLPGVITWLQHGWVHSGSRVYVESESSAADLQILCNWKLLHQARAGQVNYYLYQILGD